MGKTKTNRGFTIVELLIVIVIIGILAAITIVAYNGIQQRARVSSITSALHQASQKVTLWRVDNAGQYPSALSDTGIVDTDSVSYQYTSSTDGYCVTATSNATSYYVSNLNSVATEGICPGHNLLVWDKTAGATPPVPTAAVDTAVYRTSTESMRLGPGQTSQGLQGSPYSGTSGQTYTVSLWLRTDANWNGTGNNSKIRFGNASNNALLKACGYNGAKADWTQVICSYTSTSSSLQVSISVGNDGSAGNIWIDDLSLSLSS